MAVTIDEISALTEKLYIKLIADNVFNSNALLARMHKRGMKTDGGTAIHTPLMYARVGASGAIRGFEAMNIDADDQFTAVDFGYKEYYAAIVVSRREVLLKSGVSAKVKHLSAKAMAAEMTLRDIMGTGLQSDGTTTRLIEGLDAATQNTTVYPNTNAGDGSLGIDPSVETWWQSGFRGAATALIAGVTLGTDGSNAARIFQVFTGRLTEAPFGPTIYITTQDGFDRFHAGTVTISHSGVTPSGGQQFTDPHLASLGFETLLFRGKPIVVDSHVTGNRIFGLNENFLDLMSHEDENFTFSPYREPVNQKAMVGYVFWTGNLVCNNRRYQGLITDYAA